mmetsp:Transcript_8205/g.16564  ORF Transcript_8205/g.16564 Transcript_8205/m.16564 type:complete len:609 (-) Transcript_8205:34-1860(-)
MSTPTQSLIKMAKGRQALANVLNSGTRNSTPSAAQGAIKPSSKTLLPSTKHKGNGSSLENPASSPSTQSTSMSEEQWKVRAASIRTWIGSNPLKLGIPNDGTLETIDSQLSRGDRHPSSRNKAWHHILLELGCCGGIEALNFDAAELLSSMNTAFLSHHPSSSISTPAGADAENIDPRTEEPAITDAPEPSSVGNPSKAIFALRASSKESLNAVMAAEVISTSSDTNKSTTEAPVVPPPTLEIPALSNQNLEHLKNMPNESQSKSARNSRPKSSQLPASEVPARSIESLSARDYPKNFEEMDKLQEPKKDNTTIAANAPQNKKKQPLTMMERQELWMAKKKEKVDAKKKAKEKALAESIKPLDVSKSRQSFSLVKAKEKLSVAAREAVAAERAAASAKAAALARSTAAAKEALKEKKTNGGKSKKKSFKKAVKEVLEKKKVVAEANTLVEGEDKQHSTPFSPTTAMAKRRNSSAEVDTVPSEAFPAGDKVVSESASTPNLKSPVLETATNFVPGAFFTRYDESTRRGHLRVRDGSNFQMSTMYRKRDKFSKKGSAVAVLVGTHVDKNDEQVIEVLFDTDKMNEEECFKWWEENESRFASPKKPAPGNK